jgi:hypothetical protein
VSSEHVSNGATNGANGAAASPEWDRMRRLALIAGGVGIALFAALGLSQYAAGKDGARAFFASYLVGWIFWLSLPVGCLGFIGIQFITGASWGVLLRRVFEAATRTLPLMAALFIPIAISVVGGADTSPYPWSQKISDLTDSPSDAKELEHKFHDWTNPTGYLARSVIYFAMWGVFIFMFNRWSLRDEQSNDPQARRSMENMSGPVVALFALGNMFVATDWVMSVELRFASTMFPLIYSINQLLICFAFGVAVFLTLATQPPLKDVLRPKFQIDMGSFLLALCLVWCYMNFSQYMLIWIGNLPEEIPYYLKRQNGGWEILAYILMVFHFAFPFVLLLFRDVKLHRGRLRAMAIFLMFMAALDCVWWIEPARQHDTPLYLVMDAAAMLGIGGIWGWMFLGQLKKYPLLPTHYVNQLPGAHHAH